MSILNQAAVEALCSASYVENYLEAMDNLPDDLQRIVTQLRELDIQCRSILQDTEHHKETYMKEESGMMKKKAFIAIKRALVKCQEIGDEKLHLLTLINEFIENRQRQLEQDRENLGNFFDPTATPSVKEQHHEKEEPFIPTPPVVNNIKVKQEEKVEQRVITTPVNTNKRQRRQKNHDSMIKEEVIMDDKPKKKKKRKTKKDKEQSPVDPPIDPDEPTYCLCEQVSYGEMIGCDNDACAIEWFHFNCVGLTSKPKGRWYCPKCRGDSCKVMRKA
ncbi:inhibitor of growth protein 1-like isoform X1 [Dreissena polymorpha]|uniref:inhibitor of growth protein 1-like isoform X1 n=1 Tax=Dreissena polymorpha TaxID=45954 RepID=UPI0022641667|nr:inhibitor of growth protein 1-like isoform X1 [Dreissena polymorpha]